MKNVISSIGILSALLALPSAEAAFRIEMDFSGRMNVYNGSNTLVAGPISGVNQYLQTEQQFAYATGFNTLTGATVYVINEQGQNVVSPIQNVLTFTLNKTFFSYIDTRRDLHIYKSQGQLISAQIRNAHVIPHVMSEDLLVYVTDFTPYAGGTLNILNSSGVQVTDPIFNVVDFRVNGKLVQYKLPSGENFFLDDKGVKVAQTQATQVMANLLMMFVQPAQTGSLKGPEKSAK